MEKEKSSLLIKILVVMTAIVILIVVAVLINLREVGEKRAMEDRIIISVFGLVRITAEFIYSREGKYDNICDGSASLGVTDGLDAFQVQITGSGGTVACYASGSDYCISVQLNDGQFWRINSRGKSGRAMAACTSPLSAEDTGEEDEKEADVATHNRLLVCGQDQMIDNDGNRYDTVEIGGLCWMAENLKYLPSVSPSTAASSITEPRYYVYDYQGINVDEAKRTTNFLTYGVLYNWPAAMTACPSGTRLPTDEEFHILERTFATGSCDPNRRGWGCDPAGMALKVASPAWDGNNSSGFTAVPAGFRRTGVGGGSFSDLTTNAYFWSSSELGDTSAWPWTLSSGDSSVFRWPDYKGFGFSVRCVR